MKILYIHRTQGEGAEMVHILGIANAFRNVGASVDIFSPHGLEPLSNIGGKPAVSVKKKRKSRLSLISRHAPELVFELFEIGYNAIAWYRTRRIGVEKYDLIFERYSIFGVLGLLLARFHRLPLILEVNYTSNSPLVRRRSALLKPLARMIDRWVFNAATLITPVSTTLRDELRQEFNVPEGKIVVLPNGADPNAFSPRESPLPGGRKIIGFVGGFYPWHGLDLLVKSFAMIIDRFPEAQLLLIGDGPELERIRRLSDEMGLQKRVVFAGRKRHDELPELLSSFYLGVMPDSNQYGSPIKIFEYMALSIPVVAPDYRPILDVMTDGRQGAIFEKKNAVAFAAALARLLSDDELAQACGRRGRATVVQDRNWQSNVDTICAALALQNKADVAVST